MIDNTNTTDLAFDIVNLLKQVTPISRDSELVELKMCSDCDEYGIASQGRVDNEGNFICNECYPSPYCSICENCGEDGCCSATSCKQHPDGKYCKSYLDSMRFSHILVDRIFSEFGGDKELINRLSVVYDDVWDKFYKR